MITPSELRGLAARILRDPRGLATVLCAGLAVVVAIWLFDAKPPWEVLEKDPDLDKLTSIVRFYTWIAAALNAVLLAVLATTAFLWAAPQRGPTPAPWFDRKLPGRFFWPAITLASVLVIAQGIPRLDHSLWDDEDASVRTYIHGEWERYDDGSLQFDRPEWKHAFYNNRRATNHQLQTILSRVSNELWQAVGRPEGLRLNEPAIRLPVLLAAAGSIFSLGGLLARLGFARAGILAAFLLALHPWHLRYAAEARGYMLAIALLPAFLWALVHALDRRTWCAWGLYALTGFLLLYSHTSMLYTLLVANALAPLAVWMRNPPGSRSGQIIRFVIANLFAGMLYLQLMLPCVPQLAAFLASETMTAPLTPRWHANLAAHFFSGIPWNNSDSPFSGATELRWIVEARPFGFQTAFLVAVLFAAVGAARLGLRRPAGWLVTVAFAVPPLVVYGWAKAGGTYMYEWYLIPALPGVIAATALGADAFVRVMLPRGGLAAGVVMAALCVAFASLTHVARARLLAGSIQPMREAVLEVRPVLDPLDPRQDDVLTGKLSAPARAYDPNAIGVYSMEELIGAMRLADSQGKPFHVIYGNLPAASVDFPEVYAVLENDTYFEKLPPLRGLDPSLDRHIRRYRPGSVGRLSP